MGTRAGTLNTRLKMKHKLRQFLFDLNDSLFKHGFLYSNHWSNDHYLQIRLPPLSKIFYIKVQSSLKSFEPKYHRASVKPKKHKDWLTLCLWWCSLYQATKFCFIVGRAERDEPKLDTRKNFPKSVTAGCRRRRRHRRKRQSRSDENRRTGKSRGNDEFRRKRRISCSIHSGELSFADI